MTDLEFVSGNFFYDELPRSKEYLNAYFKTVLEKRILLYYLTFPNLYRRDEEFLTFYRNFSDHTGYVCSTRWVRKLIKRIRYLEDTLLMASKSFDLDTVSKIKSGNFDVM